MFILIFKKSATRLVALFLPVFRFRSLIKSSPEDLKVDMFLYVFYFFDIFLSIPNWKLNKLPSGVQSFCATFYFLPRELQSWYVWHLDRSKAIFGPRSEVQTKFSFFIDHRKYGPNSNPPPLMDHLKDTLVRFDAEECNRSELEKFPKTLESQLNLLTEFKMQL